MNVLVRQIQIIQKNTAKDKIPPLSTFNSILSLDITCTTSRPFSVSLLTSNCVCWGGCAYVCVWTHVCVYVFCLSQIRLLFCNSLCCSFLFLVYFLSLLHITFGGSVFQFTDSFLCLFCFALSPPAELFILVIAFSVLKFPFGSYIFYFFDETFYFFAEASCFFICFKWVHNCSLKHFYHGCFKILVNNSYISIISVLASIFFSTHCEIFWFLIWWMIFLLKPGHFYPIL